MKIGILGGSFDPVHIGHIEIANAAIHQLHLDQFIFVPTKNNPWKDNVDANSEDRLEMLNIAIKPFEKMSISTIELDQKNDDKNYTYYTLKELLEDNNKYYYIMGSDQCNSFDKWKKAKSISKMVQLVVFDRGGYKLKKDNLKKYHFVHLDIEPITASSSQIKEGDLSMLDKNVLKYISSHGIYLDLMIKSRMKTKRYNHSLSVAKLCVDLANSNDVDPTKAYIAGVMHDVAKEMDINKSRDLMNRYYSEYIDKPVPVWHQWLSAYVCKNEFLIDDEEILKAIEDHTTASTSISKLGMCLYCADKLDPLRGYDSSKSIELCKKDILEGFKNELNNFYTFSKEKGKEIDPVFNEVYDHFFNL